jgi:hypothetical protein
MEINQMTEKKKHTAPTAALRQPEISAAPRGTPAPVDNRFAYEQQMNGLPVGDRELAIEVTRLADLSRYFSENDMQIPPHICREIVESRKLAVPQRTERLHGINEELMEYVHSVSEDSELRM